MIKLQLIAWPHINEYGCDDILTLAAHLLPVAQVHSQLVSYQHAISYRLVAISLH